MQMRSVPSLFEENRPVQARTSVQFPSNLGLEIPAKFLGNIKRDIQLDPTCSRALLLLLFSYALHYAIRNIRKIRDALKLTQNEVSAIR